MIPFPELNTQPQQRFHPFPKLKSYLRKGLIWSRLLLFYLPTIVLFLHDPRTIKLFLLYLFLRPLLQKSLDSNSHRTFNKCSMQYIPGWPARRCVSLPLRRSKTRMKPQEVPHTSVVRKSIRLVTCGVFSFDALDSADL
jgi:hypothetical protein